MDRKKIKCFEDIDRDLPEGRLLVAAIGVIFGTGYPTDRLCELFEMLEYGAMMSETVSKAISIRLEEGASSEPITEEQVVDIIKSVSGFVKKPKWMKE